MKKLMVAMAALAMAYGAQAASADWNAILGEGCELYAASSSDTIGGTMYLFIADNVSQETVVNAWLGGTALENIETGNRVAQAFTVASDGTMAKTAFTGVDADTDYFVAILASNGNLFVGDAEEGKYDAMTGGMIALDESWSGDSDYDFRGDKVYSENGWYSISSPTPEPTSGLLLLIGMAGLALRRRRA